MQVTLKPPFNIIKIDKLMNQRAILHFENKLCFNLLNLHLYLAPDMLTSKRFRMSIYHLANSILLPAFIFQEIVIISSSKQTEKLIFALIQPAITLKKPVIDAL